MADSPLSTTMNPINSSADYSSAGIVNKTNHEADNIMEAGKNNEYSKAAALSTNLASKASNLKDQTQFVRDATEYQGKQNNYKKDAETLRSTMNPQKGK